jgi:6-phosphogluconolactonase
MVLLGMGDDGHVASLFPGNPALVEGLRPGAPVCLAAPAGAGGAPPPQPRLTLSMSAITSARSVLLVIAGEGKRRALEQARAGTDPFEMPVRALLQARTPLRVLWTPAEAA